MAKFQRIAIVGGGLAGLSAAIRLRELTGDSAEIHLFDASEFLGGRAASRYLKEEELLVDGAQHVTMNCCTSMLEFLRKTDLLQFWKRQEEMTFCVRNPSGPLRFFPFRNSSLLPKPFHLLPSFWRLKYFTRLERLQLLGICRQIQCSKPPAGLPFRDWLDELDCPARAANLFFDSVVLSAFSDQLENVSARMVHSIFHQMFLEAKDAWHLWVPQVPLREIFDSALTPILEGMGIQIHRLNAVKRIFPNRSSVQMVKDEAEFQADAVILAVPWFQAGRILPELVQTQTFNPGIFEPRTIAAVHFWADRELFRQKNLVLPAETIQWIFRPDFGGQENGFYYQALLSDSDRCVSMESQSLEHVVHAELQMLFPDAKFLRFRVTRNPGAVFSCSPGVEHSRPGTSTPFPTVFLAGDWTDTKLPATMESAVRSGNAAAEKTFDFLQNLGERGQF